MQMMERLRLLSVAVASGKIGYVLFVGNQPMDWGISRKASQNVEAARDYSKTLIVRFRPEVIVTEHLDTRCRKGAKSKMLIGAIATLVSDADCLDVTVPRWHTYQNKYEEAEALAATWPALRARLPKPPRIWETEPRSTILFEAASLAKVIFDDPTERLARAMG